MSRTQLKHVVLRCADGALVKDAQHTIIHGNQLVLRNCHNCRIHGRGNKLTGHDNEVLGDESLVRGDRNTVRGARCHVTGEANQLEGNYGLLIGPSNSMRGHSNTQIIRARGLSRQVRERSRSPQRVS
jgi:hypothetical protein